MDALHCIAHTTRCCNVKVVAEDTVFAGINASCVFVRAQNLTPVRVPPREITRCGVRGWCLQHSQEERGSPQMACAIVA
jgi:hypothetical protein